MPYTVWPSAADRASPAGGGIVVFPSPPGALTLTGLAPTATVTGSFTTSFAGANESPLSGGGNWFKPANAWQSQRLVGHIAKPAAYTESYDDAHSLCQAISPDDAEVIVTLFRQNSTFAEYSILVRMADTAGSPGTAAGLEFLYNTAGGVDIVRWNGGLGDFTSIIATTPNTPSAAADSNQLRATIVGTAASFYWRAVSTDAWLLIGTATYSTRATGQCGISNYVHAIGGNIDDVGFRNFTLNAL